MKKNKLILLLLIFACTSFGFSQEEATNTGKIDAYNFTPIENIFIHFNSSLLFSGEYLYYKVYCVNSSINKMSSLSKVAYVELINENKQSVFRHKVNLKNGLGQGDFFISTEIPSGNYKIIAYTQWMKNGGKNYFYKDDISILNPYQTNQKSIIDTINYSKNTIQKSKKGFDIQYLQLITNKKTFNKRDQVSLKIKSLKNTLGYGNYSLSVRKTYTNLSSEKLTSKSYINTYPKITNVALLKNSETYDPEINGSIIYGTVINKKTNQSAVDQNVSVSIPGENFIFKAETTDDEGVFGISIPESINNEIGTFQVLGKNRNDYKIEINEFPSPDISQLKFKSFKINPQMKDLIIKRSVYNQIENGYFEIKPDTIISSTKKESFFKKYNSTLYKLEDYTRFYTVKDIFIEIVENVWSTKNKEGDRVFYVTNIKDSNKNHLPLIFIDGVLIQNHELLLNYNANKIKEIRVLQGNAYFGSAIYQGVIIINTLEGDYKNNLSEDYLIEKYLFNPQPQKKYFHQKYSQDNPEMIRIPDYRNQLIWEPRLIINENEVELNFYTSDNTGTYEICLEGFTINGNPISVKELIIVK